MKAYKKSTASQSVVKLYFFLYALFYYFFGEEYLAFRPSKISCVML